MDEYQIEIQATRRHLAKLRADEAPPELIQEFEAQLRNLMALFAVASALHDDVTPATRHALHAVGYGEWTLDSVYSYVYDVATGAEDDGRDFANRITHTDFAATLLQAAAAVELEDGHASA